MLVHITNIYLPVQSVTFAAVKAKQDNSNDNIKNTILAKSFAGEGIDKSLYHMS